MNRMQEPKTNNSKIWDQKCFYDFKFCRKSFVLGWQKCSSPDKEQAISRILCILVACVRTRFFSPEFYCFCSEKHRNIYEFNETSSDMKLCILINRSSFMARPAHVFANVFDSHRHHSVAKISLFSIRQFSLFHSARHAQTHLSRCVVFIVVNMKTVTTNTQRIWWIIWHFRVVAIISSRSASQLSVLFLVCVFGVSFCNRNATDHNLFYDSFASLWFGIKSVFISFVFIFLAIKNENTFGVYILMSRTWNERKRTRTENESKSMCNICMKSISFWLSEAIETIRATDWALGKTRGNYWFLCWMKNCQISNWYLTFASFLCTANF